jgi:hypothetical protein
VFITGIPLQDVLALPARCQWRFLHTRMSGSAASIEHLFDTGQLVFRERICSLIG